MSSPCSFLHHGRQGLGGRFLSLPKQLKNIWFFNHLILDISPLDFTKPPCRLRRHQKEWIWNVMYKNSISGIHYLYTLLIIVFWKSTHHLSQGLWSVTLIQHPVSELSWRLGCALIYWFYGCVNRTRKEETKMLISTVLSYLCLVIIFSAVAGLGIVIGIRMRKRKDGSSELNGN